MRACVARTLGVRPGRAARAHTGPATRRCVKPAFKKEAAPEADIAHAMQGVETEEQLRAAMAQLREVCPEVASSFENFFDDYTAIVASTPGYSTQFCVDISKGLFSEAIKQLTAETAYKFPSYHEKEDGDSEGFDFHGFGQRFLEPLIDWEGSILGHAERWDVVQEQLAAGDNVILLANHQIEPDPNVLIHLLESSHPDITSKLAFVAGGRVTTDPISVPFSRGHNLFCVHSRKHLDDVPSEREAKTAQNRSTLRAIHNQMAKGSRIIWIAPSGGRDRPTEDGTYKPARFDPAPIGVMYLTAVHSKRPVHFYPLAMLTAPIMPPPATVSKTLGERRVIGKSAVGVSLGQELDLLAIAASVQMPSDDDAFIGALAAEAEGTTCALYAELQQALASASTPSPSWQPWRCSRDASACP